MNAEDVVRIVRTELAKVVLGIGLIIAFQTFALIVVLAR